VKAVKASFDGRCGICQSAIEEGELIVKADDEWVHAACAEDEGFEVEE
jgi:membrane protein implicated in regulation of membrane protease activity